ncbi:MAG: 50S ribosomal protein L18 [Patescibacteria group bacterium]|jgi:large subunit ribosomal protein L18
MAKKEVNKKILKARRKKRVRAKIFGTAKKPRISVFRSARHLFIQLIDDQKGVTVVSAKDTEIKAGKDKKTDLAFKTGELLGAKAQKLGITEAVFDKSSYQYHGRVKAVADGARKAGLKF